MSIVFDEIFIVGRCSVFGEECLRVANTILNIGLVYEDKEDFKSAFDYSEKALEIHRKLLPNDHVNIATSLNNIGIIYQRMNEYDLAFQYHEQALKMRQKLLPAEHDDAAGTIKIREKNFANSNGRPNFAMSLRSIGITYEHLKDYTRALEYYQRALKMIPSDDHSKISKLNDYIARTRKQMTKQTLLKLIRTRFRIMTLSFIKLPPSKSQMSLD